MAYSVPKPIQINTWTNKFSEIFPNFCRAGIKSVHKIQKKSLNSQAYEIMCKVQTNFISSNLKLQNRIDITGEKFSIVPLLQKPFVFFNRHKLCKDWFVKNQTKRRSNFLWTHLYLIKNIWIYRQNTQIIKYRKFRKLSAMLFLNSAQNSHNLKFINKCPCLSSLKTKF